MFEMRGRIWASLLLLAPLVACAGDTQCTEIGCESEATISYNGFAISGPYDLTVRLGSETYLVRCNDKGSMEELENPEFIDCDAGKFEIIGDEANHTSITVSIYDIENDESITANNSVALSVEPNGVLNPNGEDCPPTCFIRFGSVVP